MDIFEWITLMIALLGAIIGTYNTFDYHKRKREQDEYWREQWERERVRNERNHKPDHDR